VVALNRGPFLGAPATLERLDEVRGQLLDVRSARAYVGGHAPGALNVPADGPSFGTKAGFLLDVLVNDVNYNVEGSTFQILDTGTPSRGGTGFTQR
jgi:hypothetical protein